MGLIFSTTSGIFKTFPFSNCTVIVMILGGSYRVHHTILLFTDQIYSPCVCVYNYQNWCPFGHSGEGHHGRPEKNLLEIYEKKMATQRVEGAEKGPVDSIACGLRGFSPI